MVLPPVFECACREDCPVRMRHKRAPPSARRKMDALVAALPKPPLTAEPQGRLDGGACGGPDGGATGVVGHCRQRSELRR